MTKGRVETIDVFRGIAILLVVLFHFTARLPAESLNIAEGAPWRVFFGWVGVYFFFIVSGYCIFMTLERSATVGVFLARRFSRIYPPFVAAVLLLFVFGVVFQVPSVPEAHFRTVEPGLGDVALNLFFLGEIGEWVDGAFWSIAVEIKFYLLIAVLAAIFVDPPKLTRVFAWLAIVMAPLWMLSTLSTLGTPPVTPQSLLKFLVIAPYLCFFAVGILGSRIQQGALGYRGLMNTNLVLSTLVVGIEAYSFENHDGLVVALICAAAYLLLALVFYAYVTGRKIPHIPLLTPAVARVGLLSFSWYLIHENVGLSFLATFDRFMPAWMALVLVTATTFCIAVVFSALFEHRFRKPVEKLAMAVLDWLGSKIGVLKSLRATPATQPAE
ncbi:MAG: acyltransferase [Candidatus Devosia phytovorans]|uniref:Acyltransferase n=1 Tax=Candidatus Devosia phytovorans TaxID=3121372 RepID=A0AAJ5VXC2_9HYPH|nr:acyltransferase [Devosia sp.]WEK06626.1 MAG: acyltransferase [Devosia sp.]